MMYWCTVEKDYIDFLKLYEPRTPNIDYGEKHLKPFFAPLFKVDGMVYITQITSPKPRHYKMKNQLDFFKYYSESGQLLGAINLNYMFPIPQSKIIPLDMKNLSEFKKFDSEIQKSQYINFLQKQLKSITALNIDEKAIKLYRHKQQKPQDRISLRCFDYSALEIKCKEYCLKNNIKLDIPQKSISR